MRSLPGIKQVDASYREGKAVAEFEPQQVSPEQIAQAINERTYYRATVLSVGEGPFAPAGAEEARPVVTARATILVEGMDNDLAASQVLSAMGAGGVLDVSVDTSRSRLTVEFDPSRLQAFQFVNLINNRTSFRARLVESAETGGANGGFSPWWIAAATAAVGGGAILGWYALVHVRRRPAAARDERRRRRRRR